MTSEHEQRLEKASGAPRRLLAVLVGLLAALALIVSGAGAASARNVVGPQPANSILTVGPHEAAGQEAIGVRGPPLRQPASATGVAADEGAGVSKAASCLNSFTADTPVTLADGTKKPIKDVKVGTKVPELCLSPTRRDPRRQSSAYRVLMAAWMRRVGA